MNKTLKAIIISLIIDAVCCAINFLCYYTIGFAFLGLPISGGEMGGLIGFGFSKSTYYPLTTINDPIQSKTTISFEPISFIICLIIIFIIVRIILAKTNNKHEKGTTTN